MSELIQRNVVIFPTGLVRQRALNLSQMITKLVPAEFVLNDSTALPHVSVQQSCYPAEAEEPVQEVVQRVAAATPRLYIGMQDYRIFWETFMFWDAGIGHDLRMLHERLVAELNPLRQGNLLDVHQKMLVDPLTPESLKHAIREAGNPLALWTFRPHITLTRCKNETDAKRAQRDVLEVNPAPRWLSITATSLAVTEVGPHGTCPRIIAGFALAG